MSNQRLEDLISDFKFPFSKDNFEQWLVGNHKRLKWFFHREGDRLLSLLVVDNKSAAAVKISKNGELEVAAPTENMGSRTQAFLSLLLNKELPYPWSEQIDQEVYGRVIKAFAGLEALEFEGALLDLEGNASNEIRRLFKMEGHYARDEYHIEEDYTFSRFLEIGATPYPVQVLNKDAQERLYEFYEKALNRSRKLKRGQLEGAFLIFSDQTAVSLLDIYFHPYSALVEPELLENANTAYSNVDLDLFFFTGIYGGHHEVNFVKNALNNTLELGYRVWFCRDLFRKELELIEVKAFGGMGKSEWSLDRHGDGISLSCRPSDEYDGSLHLGSSRYFNTYSKTLFHATLKDELAFWRSKGLKSEGMTFDIPSDFDLDDFIYYADMFNTKFHQSLELEVEKADPKKIGLEVDLADKNNELVRFSLLYDGEEVAFPSYAAKRLFGALGNGLGAYFYEDNRDLAPRAKGPKRQNTLKLLRHAGFFHLLFHECVRAREEEISDKKLVEKIKELAMAAVLKQVHMQPSFKEQWTREFGTKAAKLINDFLTSFRSEKELLYTFQTSEGIYEVDLAGFMPKFHSYLSEFLKNTLREDVLTKQRFKELTPGKDGNSIQLKGAMVGVILSDVPVNGRILVEGRPLETLTEKDINSVFRIDDSKEAIDWFELHPEVFLKGKRVDNPEELTFHGPGCVEHGGRFYLIPKKTLPKVKWLDYFWRKLSSNTTKKSFAWEAKIEQIPKNQTLELLAMREAGIPVEGDARVQEIFDAFDAMKSRKETEDFSLPLKPFQKIGVQWMLDLYNIGLGGILADDMGLGKTVQSIGALEWLRRNKKMGHCLVVVPTSLTYNWLSEVEKFAPEIPVFNFTGPKREKHADFLKKNPQSLTVITYGLFARNCKNLENDADWNIALFDEAQNLKNIMATRTGYARKFPSKTKFCLTGTPMENHYGEFYSLVDLVAPGALGRYSDFMKVFSFKASKGVDFDKMAQDINYLRLKTAPLVMRRTKEKILKELPDKTETTLKLEFDKKQEKIYRDIAIAYNKKIKEVVDLKGDSKSQLEILSAILRLRQACSYPQALPEVKYENVPPKLEALFGQLAQIADEGHKTLIFTNFKSTLHAIQAGLEDQGQTCFVISGSTSKSKREKILKEFEKSEKPAALAMTLKTGGVGLNLTSANYVFHVEPWWNPAAEAQATDRAHRMGQTQKVQVYRYIMKDSIEEKIEMLKKRKSLAIEGLFSEDPDKVSKASYAKGGLTYKDFQYLLS